MSKRMTRVLSLILTLVMFVTVSTPAFAWGGGDLGGGWDREIGEDEIRDFDEPVVEEEETLDYFHALDEDSLLEVTVEAPMGALPTLAELRAEPVEIEDVREAVETVVDGKANILVAMDISFWMNGVEIEPEEPVNVKISAPELADKSNLTLVHIPDAAEPETIDLIDEGDLGFALGTTEIAFKANSFSVYAIVEGGEEGDDLPYRTTYEFYNADGSKYYFNDAAGNIQYTQILKDGEILEDVGIPTQGASKNAKFVGWYDEDDNKVEVGEAKTVTANKTIKLTAKLQGIVNVFFVTAVMEDDQGQPMARSIVTVQQVEYTVGQTDPITIDVNGITTEAPTTEQAVVGWNRDENAANEGTAEGTNGVITLYPDGNGEIIDVMMFPAISDACWLYFNENDGGTGGGASYTPPQFVTIGGTPTEPAAPHRTGYTFGGWYKDAACTQAFDFNAPMTVSTTVYAKWDGGATTYTIVVWVQRTADSASLPTNGQNRPEAERTYDFKRTFTVNSTTGATAVATSQSTGMGTSLDADGHIKYSRNDGPKTVAGNGSTVINVYYDRDVMRIRWYNNNNQVTDTWYGLYNATFAEANKTWKSGNWRSDRYPISVMDAFVDFDTRTDTNLNLYPDTESGNYHLYFYKENLNGGWDQVFSRRTTGNTTVTLAEKYKPGFDLDRYVRNGSNSYPANATWNNATAGGTVNSNNSNVHVRYARHSFNIEYHNGAQGTEGTSVRTDSVKFEMPLASHTNPVVSYPIAADADHYQFIGWFADSTWTTMVTFTELDQQTKENYADWYGISTFVVIDKMPAHDFPLYAGYALKGWDCAINPNGGTLTNENQAGVFWLYYGQQFSSDLKTNITREGYSFQGWMLANVPFKADGENLDLLSITTDANNHRFVGDYSNWTITDTPWQFDTGITGATALMAKWFYLETMSVQYDAGEGSNPPEDNGAYSDHATTVAFRAPTPLENHVFVGWDIQGTEAEEKLQPGGTFEVSSDYAENGVVTLVAIYNELGSEGEVPVTHIDWYANNTETAEYDDPSFVPVEGEDEVPDQIEMPLHVTDTGLQLNAGTPIKPASTFTNYGYKFLGWAKLHDDNGTKKDHNNATVAEATEADGVMDYALTADNLYLKYDEENDKFLVLFNGEWTETTEVAADEHTPYDDMYAVWEKEYFYVYHSSSRLVEKHDVSEGENGFDLTKLVSEGFLYGGYYSDYGKKGDYDIDNPAEFTSAVPNSTEYVGGIGPWKAANAIKTAKGTEMTPEAGKTYFLKEVPSVFLKSILYVIYDANNVTNPNLIVHNYLIADVDDNNYTDVGLFATNISTGSRIKLATSYSIVDTFNGKTDKINAATFGATKGYVAVWKPDLATKDFDLVPYFVTPDGVTVEGAKVRSITWGDGTYQEWATPGVTFSDADNENIIVPGQVQKAARS